MLVGIGPHMSASIVILGFLNLLFVSGSEKRNIGVIIHVSAVQKDILNKLSEILDQTIRETSQNPAQIFFNSEIHVSLSKTQVFRHHWIDEFLKCLNSKIGTYEQYVNRSCFSF